MTRVHLVTGGTGFVGACIILELLRDPDVEVICIVRPGREAEDIRLRTALNTAAHAYGLDNETILEAIKARCHAWSGNIKTKLCGVSAKMRVDEFWHSAASLRYENRYAEEIFLTNVAGTRHAVELAHHLGVDCFNYVGTAYVAGKRSGRILEEIGNTHETNNLYEASKIQAEAIVANARDLRTRIFRPSVVIGHSRTYAATNFSGLYGFMRKLLQFKGMMSRVQEGLLCRESIRMRVDPEGLLNFIPVDVVARQAVKISLSSSPASIFHLTNATPPTIAEFLLLLFEELGLKEPQFVDNKDEFSWIDTKFDQAIDFYSSYLVGSKEFDRTNSNAAIGNTYDASFPLGATKLRAYYRWYLKHLIAQRSCLVPSR